MKRFSLIEILGASIFIVGGIMMLALAAINIELVQAPKPSMGMIFVCLLMATNGLTIFLYEYSIFKSGADVQACGDP